MPTTKMPDIYISPIDKDKPEDFKRLNDELMDGFRKVKRTLSTQGMSFGYLCDITDTGSADVQFTVNHRLGVVPEGYTVSYQDKSGYIYDGDTAWDEQNMYLKASVDNMHVKLLVFVSTN